MREAGRLRYEKRRGVRRRAGPERGEGRGEAEGALPVRGRGRQPVRPRPRTATCSPLPYPVAKATREAQQATFLRLLLPCNPAPYLASLSCRPHKDPTKILPATKWHRSSLLPALRERGRLTSLFTCAVYSP